MDSIIHGERGLEGQIWVECPECGEFCDIAHRGDCWECGADLPSIDEVVIDEE